MQAIILAAGYGGRMRPLTDDLPKSMIRIAGETIIERIVRSLLRQGITDICVVTGYLREKLEDYLVAEFPNANFCFVHNELYDKTNNIFSMHLAFENGRINDDVILIESDLIFTDQVLEKLLKSKHRNAALVDKFRIGMDGTVVAIEQGLITNIIPPHLQSQDFDFSDKYKTLNIYKFSSEFIQGSFRRLLSFYATTYNDNCYYELILGILVYMQRERIYGCDVDGEKWFEVDDTNDVRLAETIFNDQARMGMLDKSFGGFWNLEFTDFAFIRNMYFPNDSMMSDIRYNLPALMHNYGSTQEILNRKLANFLLLPAERVLLLNGLSQVYPILRDLIGGKRGLVPTPTFGEYDHLFQNCGTYSLESESVEPALGNVQRQVPENDVIVFVNPNNPTGGCFPAADISRIAKAFPEKSFLVDESFVDFTLEETVQDLVAKDSLSNVVILKSLSKGLGIPGLRLGYVYTPNENLLNEIRKKLPIWNSNSLAEYFLEIILKHRRSLAESIVQTVRDRDALSAALKSKAFVVKVYPSSANFILMKLSISVEEFASVRRALLDDWRVYVKDISSKFGGGAAFVRLAVRLPEENRRLLKAFDSVMSGPSFISAKPGSRKR